MKRASVGLGLLVLLMGAIVSPGAISAQGDSTCRAALDQAVAQVAAACAGLADGAICAGEAVRLIDLSGSAAASSPVASLEGIQRVESGAFQDGGQGYGVSMLRVPALESGLFLTAILFGDATLTGVDGPPIAPACTATSIGKVNVRMQPNTEANILGQLTEGQTVPIGARLADGSWWQVDWNGQSAWIFSELALTDCDPAGMLVSDPATGEISGGQASPSFQNAVLESSFLVSTCAGIPSGGLLAQTPSGGATWRINDLVMRLDGTALIQAGENDVLLVNVLEGTVGLAFHGLNRQAAAGQILRVPLQAGQPVGIPGPAMDGLVPDAAALPIALLPRPIALPDIADLATPSMTAEGLVCGVQPAQVVVPVEAGMARIAVSAAPGETLRISAEAGSAFRALAVQDATGTETVLVEGNSPDQVADLTAGSGGTLVFLAQAVTDAQVRFGVTCGLPEAAPLPERQSCDAVLMRWMRVQGNAVEFSAPAGAVVSVIAQHDLPSEGSARQLTALDESGNTLAEMPFLGFSTVQAAGQLEFSVPEDGVFTIRWDGDPFNPVDVEAVCSGPAE